MTTTGNVDVSSYVNLIYLILAILGLNLFGTFGIAFKINRTWTRLIDRSDEMYEEYCANHNIPFKPINNGKH